MNTSSILDIAYRQTVPTPLYLKNDTICFIRKITRHWSSASTFVAYFYKLNRISLAVIRYTFPFPENKLICFAPFSSFFPRDLAHSSTFRVDISRRVSCSRSLSAFPPAVDAIISSWTSTKILKTEVRQVCSTVGEGKHGSSEVSLIIIRARICMR